MVSERVSVSLTALFSMSHSSVSRSLLLSLSLGMLLTACNEPDRAAVLNETDQQIGVFVLSDQSSRNDVLAMSLEPGGSLSLSGQLFPDCTAESLVARTASGEEIERRGPGMCEGDVWRVNGDPED
jgi:hypothetical protein